MGTAATGGSGRLQRLLTRVEELLWGRDDHGFAAEAFRVAGVTLWKFQQDRAFLRASALTYATLLSLVPLLAFMFSVLKGLGVQERLEPLLLEHLAVGNEEVVSRVLEYVDRTKVGALGAVGLVALLLTAVSVLSNIELSFNDIWQIRRGRSLIRKVSDYTALLVVGPVLLLLSLSVTTTLESAAVRERLFILGDAVPTLVKSLPFLAVWIAFTALYLIMPNRRVPLVSALLAGAVAGGVWQVAEVLYVRFQFGITRYNAIYGAMAQLPLLLAWVYLSWCIVLLGAELAFVHQLPGRGRYLRVRNELWVPRLDVALAILLAVARRFETGAPPHQEQDLVSDLDLHPEEASRVIHRLYEVGLLAATQDEPPGLLPARSPDRTPAAELLDLVAQLSRPDGAAPVFQARLRAMLEEGLGGVTWADLALEEP
ncbi:MAG: YhjD/YihY/BrkB family envelope integrity protein [Deferrisomatales bacterium]|nr:YhjD/YihY/BrkB family envelope integrity protein [Deferrisomatales bacterium]